MPPFERITADPEILAGKPVIRGTRLAVDFILEQLAAGQSEQELLASLSWPYVYPVATGRPGVATFGSSGNLSGG